MIRLLDIRDFALVDHVTLEFKKGLSMLTGETGSGKSIIVDALGLLLGSKSYSEMIRSGFSKAIVTGLFEVYQEDDLRQIFENAGVDFDPEEILIRREIIQNGRGRAFINNQMIPITFLRKIRNYLVDIHGQSEQQSLLNSDSQLMFLDRFANNENILTEVEGLHDEFRKLEVKMKKLKINEEERLQTIELLSFQLDDIEKVGLASEDEEEDLQKERLLLSNSDRLFQASHQAYELLYESENSAGRLLKQVDDWLKDLQAIDKSCQELRSQFREASITIEDIALSLRKYNTGIEVDPKRLDWIEERLNDIGKLKRKYGSSVKEIKTYADKIKHEIVELKDSYNSLETMEEDRRLLLDKYFKKAKKLSYIRKNAFQELKKSIQDELRYLAMEKTLFEINFLSVLNQGKEDSLADCLPLGTSRGIDLVEFMISPNPGEDLKALVKIASGGEISRIMLALKTICTVDNDGKTLVFDEVDAGIGGEVADAVGKKLQKLSKSNQVLCVTHLPQIASYADNHFHVEKIVKEGRTVTHVLELTPEHRIHEIARMISGKKVTGNILKHAAELLNNSLT